MIIDVSDSVFCDCDCLWLSLEFELVGGGVLNTDFVASAFGVDGSGDGPDLARDDVLAACIILKLFLFCCDISRIFEIDACGSFTFCRGKKNNTNHNEINTNKNYTKKYLTVAINYRFRC